MTDDRTIKFVLIATDNPERLDKLLVAYMQEHWGDLDLSRSRLQECIRQGCVCIGDEVIADSAYLIRGEVAGVLSLPVAVAADVVATEMDLSIVYEDEHVLVIDKPAGLTVHPGAGNYDKTLVNGLLHYFGAGGEGREGREGLSGVGGVLRPGIVHRLDKDTSGLLVVAKTDVAHHGLAEQFATHTVGRVYTALVWGCPKPFEGVIESSIIRHAKDRKRMMVAKEGGKWAVTHYRVLELLGAVSLVECRLETGRTHQIRVHLSHAGHALVGDSIYGGRAIGDFCRQALHAGYLSFTHPVSGEMLEFHAELPDDFRLLLESVRQEI